MGKGALLGLFVTLAVISLVSGHGRLLDPPSRSSLWRFGEFAHRNPPQNLDDNELFCGGFKARKASTFIYMSMCDVLHIYYTRIYQNLGAVRSERWEVWGLWRRLAPPSAP
jgi:hypothetical protein